MKKYTVILLYMGREKGTYADTPYVFRTTARTFTRAIHNAREELAGDATDTWDDLFAVAVFDGWLENLI